MLGSTPLETAHLTLALADPRDLLALVEGHPPDSLTALGAFYGSGAVSPQWIAALRRAAGVDAWRHGFFVRERGSEQVIGAAGFKGPPDADGMVEIAYGIVPACEGRGFATEAARALMQFASADPRVQLVRAHTLPEPNASTRVLTKCGFVHVGDVVDPDDGPVWRWERPTRHIVTR